MWPWLGSSCVSIRLPPVEAEAADHERHARAVAADDSARQRRGHESKRRHRQRVEPAVDGRQPAVALEVQVRHEQESPEGCERGYRRHSSRR